MKDNLRGMLRLIAAWRDRIKIALDQFDLTRHELCVNPCGGDKALRGVGFVAKKPAKWGKNIKNAPRFAFPSGFVSER
jgi:hypothetical protein